MFLALGLRQFISPHLITELQPHEDPSLRERQEVPVDSRPIQITLAKTRGQFRVADGYLKQRKLTQDEQSLVRDAKPVLGEQSTPSVFSIRKGSRRHGPEASLIVPRPARKRGGTTCRAAPPRTFGRSIDVRKPPHQLWKGAGVRHLGDYFRFFSGVRLRCWRS